MIIMMLIFILKIINPNNVHINNGNHEEREMNKQYGFKTQLISIFGHDVGTKIWENFNNIFILNHSAIMIENPNIKREYIYLAHGGFPVEDENIENTSICGLIPPSKFPSEFNEDTINNKLNKISYRISLIKYYF